MLDSQKTPQVRIEKPLYFSNWLDNYCYFLTRRLLPFVSKYHWITPNIITLFSFALFAVGSSLIFIKIPYQQYIAPIFLLLAFIGDELDGQLARSKKLSSALGNYLDCQLDFFKIFIITISLTFAAYLNTSNVLYVFLGFIASFFFSYRAYIKIEIMLSQAERDPQYFLHRSQRIEAHLEEINTQYKNFSMSFSGKLKLFWLKNRTLFWVDEGEFIFIASAGLLFNQVELVLWILAISQTLLALWRLFQRGFQTHKQQDKLLEQLRH